MRIQTNKYFNGVVLMWITSIPEMEAFNRYCETCTSVNKLPYIKGYLHFYFNALSMIVRKQTQLLQLQCSLKIFNCKFIKQYYSEASLIRTPIIRIIHLSRHMFGNQLLLDNIESDSFIRIFSYPDSQFGNGGVRISDLPLYFWIKFC